MNSITFNITNNAWVNNGLARLIVELNKHFYDDVSINKKGDAFVLSSNTDKDIDFYLNEIILYLAAYGTYNFSQVFKSINKNLNYSFNLPKEYPNVNDDFKSKEDISKEIRDDLKKFDKRQVKPKEQIWKMRRSYINNSNNYLKYGLNFISTAESKKLFENEFKNSICPNCGLISKNMIEMKQSFNPLINEHHNNEIDGFSTNFRKKSKFCPNCFYLSLISVFDKFIPFYSNNNQIILALPNIYDFNILEKIVINLSLDSQFINFSDPNIIGYNTNIKNFSNNISKSANLLCLLNNIQNNFSKDYNDDVFQIFTENELMNIVDWIFITKDSSYSINRIKASNNVYKILKSKKDKNGNDIYLVNDFFNKINFKSVSPYQVEKFFNSFLKLDYQKISLSLFDIFKSDVDFYGNSYPIYLFKEFFLNQILGEIIMLNDSFKKSSKSIAETIGKAFYTDVGLLSKFAYATDKKIFNETIEEAFFLMAKRSSLSDEKFYPNRNELEIFFNEFDNEDFNEVKSYFVSFMSSSALYAKYSETNKNNDKGE